MQFADSFSVKRQSAVFLLTSKLVSSDLGLFLIQFVNILFQVELIQILRMPFKRSQNVLYQRGKYIIYLIAVFAFILPSFVHMRNQLTEENDLIIKQSAHISMLLQQIKFYTWLSVNIVYLLVSVVCIYCIVVGMFCDIGYGSKGINKQINQAQLWPRVQFILAMLLVEVPINVFKFIRLFQVDKAYEDINKSTVD